MKSTQTWQERQQAQKAERRRQVVRAALGIFMRQGIEASTMNEVAAAAGIGIASAYRYFATKQELVIEAGKLFWQEEIQAIYEAHERASASRSDGLSRVEDLLGIYLELFDAGQDSYRFLEQFDQYVIREGIAPERLAEYDRSLGGVRGLFEQALVRGMRDGSIRADIPVERFASTVAVAALAFAQKLVSRGRIVPSDAAVDARRELELFIDMVGRYLKAS